MYINGNDKFKFASVYIDLYKKQTQNR